MKRLMPLFLVALLVPQIAMAAWWNPVSWFKKQSIDQEKTELLERLVELEEKADSQEVATSTASEESVKSEIREKIITQTITVDNPDLQKRINALIEENISLQAKVMSQSSLVGQLNSCKADLIDLRAQLNKPTTEPEGSTQTEPQTNSPVTFGRVTCRDNYIIDIPITFTGVNDKYALVEISSDSGQPSKQQLAPTVGTKLATMPFRTGNYNVKLTLSSESLTSLSYKYDPTIKTYSTQFEITKECIPSNF